jgi:thioredoxin reductase
MKEYNLLIIGAGPAGLSAALAVCGRGVRGIAVIDRLPGPGGILTQCFHQGFSAYSGGREWTGPEYAAQLSSEIDHSRVEIILNTTAVHLDAQGAVTLAGNAEGVRRVKGRAVILATGCRERAIGSLPVYGTRPAGVFTAGSVQKMINLSRRKVGERVIILGSGDVGMIVAHHLTESGSQVAAVLEKQGQAGGLARNKRLFLDRHGIPLITHRTAVCLHGENRLEGVTVRRTDTQGNPVPGTESRIECDTLVTSLGLVPELELIRKLCAGGAPGRGDSSCGHDGVTTDIPWLFVCGNARQVHRLAEAACADGFQAGLAAADYLHFLQS